MPDIGVWKKSSDDDDGAPVVVLHVVLDVAPEAVDLRTLHEVSMGVGGSGENGDEIASPVRQWRSLASSSLIGRSEVVTVLSDTGPVSDTWRSDTVTVSGVKLVVEACSQCATLRSRPGWWRTATMPVRGVQVRLLRALALSFTLVVGTALSACASLDSRMTDADSVRVEGTVVPATCRSGSDKGVMKYSQPLFPNVTAGGEPKAFVATGVMRCAVTGSADVGGAVLAKTVVAEQGDLSDALARAVGLPDQRFVNPDGAVCSLEAEMRPYLLFTDDHGQSYRPYLPTDACGNIRPEINQALRTLHLVRTDTYVVKQELEGRN